MSEPYHIFCVGGGILPHEEKCPVGWHKVDGKGDTKPYNGVRNWRCPDCFKKHVKRVREKNN